MSTCQLDFFHICYTLGFTVLTAELVGGIIPDEPVLQLLAMPAPSLLLIVGGLLVISWAMGAAGIKPHFRVSSLLAGTPTRPLVYTIMEDIVAVDGNGGQQWREALNARYEASPAFRQMLIRLNVFWGFAAVILGTILTIIIFTTPKTTGYGIGELLIT